MTAEATETNAWN